MTRRQYINHTIRAICGDNPAPPDVYHLAVRMSDRVAKVYQFDYE